MSKKKQAPPIPEPEPIELTPEQEEAYEKQRAELEGEFLPPSRHSFIMTDWEEWQDVSFETWLDVRRKIATAFYQCQRDHDLKNVQCDVVINDYTKARATREEERKAEAELAEIKAKWASKKGQSQSTVIKEWSKEMAEIAERLQAITDEMQEKFDEKSESWQESERGYELSEYMERLQDIASQLTD